MVIIAKKNRFLSELVKRLNIGRSFEIAHIIAGANLQEKDVVCDIGCGDGYWSHLFSRGVSRVLAFDPFRADLKRALEFSSQRLIFIQAVGENIPLPNSSVDKVISVCVFEHFYDDRRVFREIFRILKPGGRLVATVDSLNSPFISPDFREWHKKACYCSQLYSSENLSEKLLGAGFQNIKVSYLMGSRLAILWEIMTEKIGFITIFFSIFITPFIRFAEKRERTSGYKIFVQAEK